MWNESNMDRGAFHPDQNKKKKTYTQTTTE